MPRPPRVLVEGGLYHVYNRLARGEQHFLRDEEAGEFVSRLREVVERDDLTVYAWCLMSNHYHLAVRAGAVPMDRPMKSLQQRVTRAVNSRHRVHGPMWQGRYRCKVVDDQRYLDQLLIYIHLNPLLAGVVDDPAGYRWSGHHELLGAAKKPVIDVDEVLRVFGRTRRSARAAYVRRLKGGLDEEWIGEEPGRLPWWKLGRPPKSEQEDPEAAIRERRAKEEMGPEWRPAYEPEEFVRRSTALLGVRVEELMSRSRSPNLVWARELLLVVGVERYGLKVNALAREFRKTPNGMSQALARAVRRRVEDGEFREQIHRLDDALAQEKDQPVES